MRPVTPVGILAELAGGLDPYVSRCTTPESPALAALARETAAHDWGGTGVEPEMLSGHVEGLPPWQRASIRARGIARGKCNEILPYIEQLIAYENPRAWPVIQAIKDEGDTGCGPGGARPCNECMSEAFTLARQTLAPAEEALPATGDPAAQPLSPEETGDAPEEAQAPASPAPSGD